MTNFVIHIQQIDANIVADDGVDVIPKFQHRTKSRMNCSKFAPQQTVSSVIGLDTTTIIFWYSNKLSGSNLFHSITLEISVRVFLCVSEIDNVMIDTNREKQKKKYTNNAKQFFGRQQEQNRRIECEQIHSCAPIADTAVITHTHTESYYILKWLSSAVLVFSLILVITSYSIVDADARSVLSSPLTYTHHTRHTQTSAQLGEWAVNCRLFVVPCW